MAGVMGLPYDSGVRAVPDTEGSQAPGPWILTFTGIEFYPLDPRPDDIRVTDIAHALANQCRYSGHTLFFYSVAEHCVHVSRMVHGATKSSVAALDALLHDASEAYLVDLPGPLKMQWAVGGEYRKAEHRLQSAIRSAFGLDGEIPDVVGKADRAMLWFEYRTLMQRHEWFEKWSRFTGRFSEPKIECWDPGVAEMRFLGRFLELSEK